MDSLKPSSFEDGGNVFNQNVDSGLYVHMVLHPKRRIHRRQNLRSYIIDISHGFSQTLQANSAVGI